MWLWVLMWLWRLGRDGLKGSSGASVTSGSSGSSVASGSSGSSVPPVPLALLSALVLQFL